MLVKLEDVCERASSNLRQSDVEGKTGDYPIFGAAGYIGNVDFFHQEKPYVAVVKDGAGIGRTMLLPAKSSVIGTMQYLLPKENILPEYLRYVVQYMHLEKYFSGATIPHIYFRDYKEEKFNLDERKRQVEIVCILGKLERIIQMRMQQLSALDALIKSRFIEMFGDPEFNAKSWPIQPLGKLCNVGSSKRIYQNELSQKGIPFWRISDLINKMDTGVAESGLYIPEEKYLELVKEGLVPLPGDILITSRGTLGRCYIIKDGDRFYFQDGMISWLNSYVESITPLYLQYLFMMPGFMKQIDSMQSGSTVAYLSIAMLKKLMIMIPNIDKQKCFASFIAKVNKTKSAIQKSLEETQLLFDSLMQTYFG